MGASTSVGAKMVSCSVDVIITSVRVLNPSPYCFAMGTVEPQATRCVNLLDFAGFTFPRGQQLYQGNDDYERQNH